MSFQSLPRHGVKEFVIDGQTDDAIYLQGTTLPLILTALPCFVGGTYPLLVRVPETKPDFGTVCLLTAGGHAKPSACGSSLSSLASFKTCGLDDQSRSLLRGWAADVCTKAEHGSMIIHA